MHLSKKKTQFNQFLALFFSGLIGLCYFLVISNINNLSSNLFYILLAVGAVACFNFYSIFTKKFRDRKQLQQMPFPEKWRAILDKYVLFYKALNEEEKRRFETEIQIFLHETRVTGIQTEIDDVTLVLAAASAEIPVFSFPEWEYDNLGEILIYPGPFTKDFRIEGEGRTVTGMVGTGLMQGIMILSKPALIAGFANPTDKKNVGIHEFVHLLDAADGSYDGIPKQFMQHQYIAPWLEIIRKETERIKKGHSEMNPYGATNSVEFFAVASEYFFEHPKSLQKNKPELYELLCHVFQQDTKNRLKVAFKAMLNYTGNKVGRNAPCPCGSGKKYKQCCLKNARTY
ncbi:zinc-dependent peptidase [Aureispira anguillae]|uniref:Zinc-dependent peptidase n=1 Tax=Aureispira anguillae TaxID=2864201 RepID=A0A916DUV5_9BACT|nr:zinc-dependent peptidase [Aureispira anguillae]BDS14469.1 zinc-dependent peptidase [Aureispira anguillae]